MPRVKSENTIAAPLEDVWKMAQDVEQMPSFMPDLVSVKILEEEQTSPVTRRTVTEWMGRIKQFNRNVHWVEEDIWNDDEKACHFWQIRGDYTEYRGTWKFVEQGGSTQALLEIEYVIDIPLLGALMQKIVKKLMQENCDTMLSCLKNQAEK
jgi:uncharacterized membrane protein